MKPFITDKRVRQSISSQSIAVEDLSLNQPLDSFPDQACIISTFPVFTFNITGKGKGPRQKPKMVAPAKEEPVWPGHSPSGAAVETKKIIHCVIHLPTLHNETLLSSFSVLRPGGRGQQKLMMNFIHSATNCTSMTENSGILPHIYGILSMHVQSYTVQSTVMLMKLTPFCDSQLCMFPNNRA